MKVVWSCAGLSVDGVAVVGEAFEDLVGGFVPDERGGVVVPGCGPSLDVGGEFVDVAQLAPMRLTWYRFAPLRFAPLRSAPARLA